MENKQKEVIDRELKYWKTAYPKQADLLEKFALKIKLELDLLIPSEVILCEKCDRKVKRPYYLEGNIIICENCYNREQEKI